MQRFFISEKIDPGQSSISVIDGNLIHQLSRVLRASIGDHVILLDNTGYEYESKILTLSGKAATFRTLSKRKNEAEPWVRLVLYQALPKKIELFEWVLQKGTEVGVSAFVPFITTRTERPAESFAKKRERLLRILREAAEQSGRGKIPELLEPLSFSKALEKISKQNAFLFDASGKPLSELLIKTALETAPEIHCFIGPEGGFTAEEISAAQKLRVTIISLGARTLRTETAGIVASTLFLLKERPGRLNWLGR